MGKQQTSEGAEMDQSIPFMSRGQRQTQDKWTKCSLFGGNETSFLSQKRQPHVLNAKHEGPSES